MARKDSPTDMYGQFFPMVVETDATDSEVLVEQEYTTGLSVRGQHAWLVHQVEFQQEHIEQSAAAAYYEIAVSTRPGLVVMPVLEDPGVIALYRLHVHVVTQGGHSRVLPHAVNLLPPIPIVSPKLSIYARCSWDIATNRGKRMEARLLFTTTPMTPDMYAEVAETWSQG